METRTERPTGGPSPGGGRPARQAQPATTAGGGDETISERELQYVRTLAERMGWSAEALAGLIRFNGAAAVEQLTRQQYAYVVNGLVNLDHRGFFHEVNQVEVWLDELYDELQAAGDELAICTSMGRFLRKLLPLRYDANRSFGAKQMDHLATPRFAAVRQSQQ